ncbi:MAG TPA: hypothetical protein VLA96_07455 [Terriglobales bacterium]|nr:hypothetical protein [Terriglobales bacterium]
MNLRRCLTLALALGALSGVRAFPDDPKPLVLHVLRSPESALEPWLHDTSRWFIRQSKTPVEIVFLDAQPKGAAPDAKSQTSSAVADTPPQPDLVILEANLEPGLYGITLPPDAKSVGKADLVLAAVRFPKQNLSLAQALAGKARRAALVQAAADSAAGMYALYLESLAARRSKRAADAKDVDAQPLETLLRDQTVTRDRYLLIPDTWCGALKEKGQALAARYPTEGFVQMKIVGFVPAGSDEKRAKLARELLDFLALRGRTDPPPKCAAEPAGLTPIATPSPEQVQAIYAGFKKSR